MQVKGLVEQLNGSFFVLMLSPCDDSLKVCVVTALRLRLAHLHQEVKLLLSILELILLYLAVNHAVQWGLVGLIEV